MESNPCWQDYAQALQENGQTVFVKQSVPLEVYYGIANSLLTEASMCRKRQDLPELYTVLMRLANLRAEGIPTHKDYDSANYCHQRAYFRKLLLNDVLPELERLKPELQRRMEQLKKLDRLSQIQDLSQMPVFRPSPSKVPAGEPVHPPLRHPANRGMPASPRNSPRDSPHGSARGSPRDSPCAPVPFRTSWGPSTATRFYPHPPSRTHPSSPLPLPEYPVSESSTSSLSETPVSEHSSSQLTASPSSLHAAENASSRRSSRFPPSGCLRERHSQEDLPEKAPTDNNPLKSELRLSIPEHKEENYGRHLAPPWDPYALLPMSFETAEIELPTCRKLGITLSDGHQGPPISPTGLKSKGRLSKGLDISYDLSESSISSCKPANLANRLTAGYETSSPAYVGLFETFSPSSREGYGSSDDDVSAPRDKQRLSGVKGLSGFEGLLDFRGPSVLEGPSVIEGLSSIEELSDTEGLADAVEGFKVSRVEGLYGVTCKPGRRWNGSEKLCRSNSQSTQLGPLASPSSKVSLPLTSEDVTYTEEAPLDMLDSLEDENEEGTRDSGQRLTPTLQAEYNWEPVLELASEPQRAEEMFQCSICFEDFPSRDCVRACIDPRIDDTAREKAQGSAAALDAGERVLCSHWHCVDCLRQYASLKVVESRLSRIVCTSTGCPGVFLFEDVEWLLGTNERDVYTALLAEDLMTCKVYCPFDDCDTVMEWAEDERGPDSTCVVCKRVFCRICCVAWHYGKTCQEYENLKEDGPLHELANKRKWKSCPKCKHMIERQDGCNFVKCKCGCGFCYKCGKAYTSSSGGTNGHGKPGCTCKLY